METKSFFSDDVIQRITSGIEPTQTKISLDVLKNVLKPHQLRNVLGGSGGGYCCAYNTDWTQPGVRCVGNGNPVEAEFMAGPNGHWECGTPLAKKACCESGYSGCCD